MTGRLPFNMDQETWDMVQARWDDLSELTVDDALAVADRAWRPRHDTHEEALRVLAAEVRRQRETPPADRD